MVKTLRPVALFLSIFAVYFNLYGCTHHPTTTDKPDTHQNITKSANDSREYKSFSLPNQLRVLVISDPNTDKAAASLDVHVGSSSNPPQRQGLAHFLEHMLFLGTEKYPESGEYQRFISEHGGSHNAYTAFEHTNYFFDVDRDHLAPTLDRFAQFFIAPLFNAEYVEREKHAVDSEYQSKLKEDGRRQYDAIRALANPNHPFSGFSVGSLDTLEDRPGSSIRDELIGFYRSHYSANLMTLVVLGKQSTTELETMVTQLFSGIPNRQATPPQIDQPLFESTRLPLRIDISPVKDIRHLSIQFPLPSVYPYYRTKPTHYIANLLGHEGRGSLLSYLKQRGWAESLSAGLGHNASDASTFNISVTLTRQGLQQTDAILEAIFAYIWLIKERGIESWRFKEQQRLSEMEFDFKENGSNMHYVTTLASRLHHYPESEVLRAPYSMDRFEPELIAQLLAQMTPDNMILTRVAKGLKTDSVSPWFNAPYAHHPISSRQLADWQSPPSYKELKLPEENPFIPENLSVKSDTDNSPIPVASNIMQGITLLHRKDVSFNTPRANFYFAIRSPKANDSPEHALLTELYVKAANDQLSEFSYPAYLAGLNYRLYNHVRGITVRISGYQDKQDVLLDAIKEVLHRPEINGDRFAIFKDELIRKLDNAQNDRPYNQTLDRVSKLLLLSSWTDQQLKDALKPLEPADLRAFIPEFLESIEIVALANGNLETSEAQQMAQGLAHQFLQEANRAKVAHQPVIRLDNGKPALHHFNVNHADSAIVSYIQGDDKSIATRARFALFNQILSAPFYQALRTEQQRGYIVFSTPMTLMDVPALGLVIQSPNTSGIELGEHIDQFLSDFDSKIQAMSPSDFEQHKQSLISRILEKETRLSQRSNRYWYEIDRENYAFDTRDRLAEAVMQFPLAQLKQDYRSYLLQGNKRGLTIIANGDRFSVNEKDLEAYRMIEERADLVQDFF